MHFRRLSSQGGDCPSFLIYFAQFRPVMALSPAGCLDLTPPRVASSLVVLRLFRIVQCMTHRLRTLGNRPGICRTNVDLPSADACVNVMPDALSVIQCSVTITAVTSPTQTHRRRNGLLVVGKSRTFVLHKLARYLLCICMRGDNSVSRNIPIKPLCRNEWSNTWHLAALLMELKF